jgi:hypothetical protein
MPQFICDRTFGNLLKHTIQARCIMDSPLSEKGGQGRFKEIFYAYIHDEHERPCPFPWYRVGQRKLKSSRSCVHARLQ